MLEMVRKEVDEQGRIVIPKEWRKDMKIKEHTIVEMTRKDGRIEIVSAKKKSPMDFKGIAKDTGDLVDIEEGEKAEMEASIERYEKARRNVK